MLAVPAFAGRTALATVTDAAGQSTVYAIGGNGPGGVPIDKVTAYDVATSTWTFRRRLPRPLAGSDGAGVINGKIYLSGGYSEYGGFSLVGSSSSTIPPPIPGHDEDCNPLFFRYNPVTDR